MSQTQWNSDDQNSLLSQKRKIVKAHRGSSMGHKNSDVHIGSLGGTVYMIWANTSAASI